MVTRLYKDKIDLLKFAMTPCKFNFRDEVIPVLTKYYVCETTSLKPLAKIIIIYLKPCFDRKPLTYLRLA